MATESEVTGLLNWSQMPFPVDFLGVLIKTQRLLSKPINEKISKTTIWGMLPSKKEIAMRRLGRFLTILVITVLISLFVVHSVWAQEGAPFDPVNLLAPFAPILAASTAIERFLQLIRNIISPDPEIGPLARGSKALRYYTTIGGTTLGLGMVYLSNLRLLESVGITFNDLADTILTGVVVGMGSEFVHEIIKVIAEGKDALRANAQRDQAVG